MSGRLHGDRPISHPSDDAFGFAIFADALATSLLQMSPKDGLVISVEGPWGGGKSSAIALAVRRIKLRLLTGMGESQTELEKLTEEQVDTRWSSKAKVRQTHIVHFNPWIFSGQENLVRAFFKELAAQIDVEPEGGLKKAMNQVAGYLPSVAGMLGGVGMLAIGSIPAAAAASAGGRALGEATERLLKSDVSLESAKSNLSYELTQTGHRIIVFIDDIDRLMPIEMRAVLSLVKSLGDLPNVLYVLSFDEAVVRNALEGGPEKIDPAFLEKIVQVSLKLPPPWRGELRQFLFTRLNLVIGDAVPADQVRWERMLLKAIEPYLQTPRDVTRLVNAIQVVWPNVEGDVDLADLIAITTLQLFDPTVHAFIRSEIEVLTYADYRYEEDVKFGERMLPPNPKQPQAAKEAMALMFPRLAKAWKSTMADATYYISQKEQRRISTKEYHRNYFAFGRDTRMLSRASIEALVMAPDPSPILASILERLTADKDDQKPSRVSNFLAQIAEALYAKPLLSSNLMRAILDHSDALIRREDLAWDFFVTNNMDRLKTIVRLGLDKLEAVKREQILLVLVTYRNGLQLRAVLIESDARANGHFGGQEKSADELLFARDAIKDAAGSIHEEIEAACIDGSVWNAPLPLELVWAWHRMGAGTRFEAWMGDVIADDKLVVQLGNELPERSYRSSSRSGSSIEWTFRRDQWTGLMDVEELFRRLKMLAISSVEAGNTLRRLEAAANASNENAI